jgi:membrane dipeptidase
MTSDALPTVIVDAHQDIAYHHLLLGRDYRRPALVTRRSEDNSRKWVKKRGLASNGLPDAILGRVAIVFGTLFVSPSWSKYAVPPIAYETQEQAYNLAWQELDYYHRLADETERVHLIQTERDLDDVLATWGPDTGYEDHHLGIMVSMEGADPIRDPQHLDEWYERGLRAIGLAWSETRYAGGTGRPGPLTDLGRELLEAMVERQMLLDLSHLTDEGFWEASDRYEGPLVASHSNPRHFVDSERMLSDTMIERLAERDGVMGIVPANAFLKKGWVYGDPSDAVTLDTVAAAIDYVCQLTGSARYVGIGSDIDGGFGAESFPFGMDTVTDLWLLKNSLAERGYTPEDIRAILGGNFLRKMRECLP